MFCSCSDRFVVYSICGVADVVAVEIKVLYE